MKKFMVAIAALLCGAAMLFAQTSEVKLATSGLIEDGAIDSLDFGTDIDGGLTFIQFNGSAENVNFGWGKWLGDSFWLSVYDSWYNNDASLTNQAVIAKTYGTRDGINIDYTDELKRQNVGKDQWNIRNNFALGLGFGSFGTQLYWNTNWTEYQGATAISAWDASTGGLVTGISSESYDTPTGTKTTIKYDKIQNRYVVNGFGINFDGLGVKDIGDIDFYVELKALRFNWQNFTKANDYKNTVTVNGKDTTNVKASVSDLTNLFDPGLAFELGMTLADKDVVKTKLIFEDSFWVGFKGDAVSNTYKSVTEDVGTKTTTERKYTTDPGKYFSISNTLTPKFEFDFDLGDNLTLVAQVAADVYIDNTKSPSRTYKRTTTTTTLNKSTGDETVIKTVTTGPLYSNNTEEFTTSVTPKYSLGLVYQVKPGKMNLNFGVSVDRAPYQWKVTTVTNANINTVTTTENTDALGNKGGSKTVNVNTGSGAETKTLVYSAPNGTSTAFRIGGTWFFTENVKLDAYYGNSFQNLVSGGNLFGIDLCVMF